MAAIHSWQDHQGLMTCLQLCSVRHWLRRWVSLSEGCCLCWTYLTFSWSVCNFCKGVYPWTVSAHIAGSVPFMHPCIDAGTSPSSLRVLETSTFQECWLQIAHRLKAWQTKSLKLLEYQIFITHTITGSLWWRCLLTIIVESYVYSIYMITNNNSPHICLQNYTSNVLPKIAQPYRTTSNILW